MKTIILGLLIAAYVSASDSTGTINVDFNKTQPIPIYVISKQKDPLKAALSGFIVPGGANIYSENYLLGALCAVIEIGGGIFLGTGIASESSGAITAGSIIMGVGLWLDIYSGMYSANAYSNKYDLTKNNSTSKNDLIFKNEFDLKLISFNF